MTYFSSLDKKFPVAGCFAAMAACLTVPSGHSAGLVNPGFELPVLTRGVADFATFNESVVTGWKTTALDRLIEIWSDGFASSDGFGPINAFEGTQHAELNANSVATLYQDSTGIAAGSLVGFTFAHRGRLGVDTLRLTITDLGANNVPGGGDDSTLFTKLYSDNRFAWSQYTSAAEAPIVTLGNNIRFAYESVSAAGGDSTYGNFLDAVNFGVGVPEPTTTMLMFGALIPTLAVRSRRKTKGQPRGARVQLSRMGGVTKAEGAFVWLPTPSAATRSTQSRARAAQSPSPR